MSRAYRASGKCKGENNEKNEGVDIENALGRLVPS